MSLLQPEMTVNVGISDSFADVGQSVAIAARVRHPAGFRRYGHDAWAVNGVASPVPYLCRSAASHGVSIVSSKLFPSMLT
jgi:hypothetical protein